MKITYLVGVDIRLHMVVIVIYKHILPESDPDDILFIEFEGDKHVDVLSVSALSRKRRNMNDIASCLSFMTHDNIQDLGDFDI